MPQLVEAFHIALSDFGVAEDIRTEAELEGTRSGAKLDKVVGDIARDKPAKMST